MSDALFEILRKVTTATITTMLLKKGIRRAWMNGPKPLVRGAARIVGRAFTLRFIPVREQFHSNILGLGVQLGLFPTDQRIHGLSAAFASQSVGAAQATARAVDVVSLQVRQQALRNWCV